MFKKPFYTIPTVELGAKNIEELISTHAEVQAQYRKAMDYYEGNHKILYREVTEINKPNNKIIENLPQFAADIRTGYFSGEPITLKGEDTTFLQIIKDNFEYNDFNDLNSELDLLSSIYGHAFATMWIDGDSIPRITAETPTNIIMLHDNTIEKAPVAAIRYTVNKEEVIAEYYTKDVIKTYKGTKYGLELIEEKENYFKMLPIVEFLENNFRKGCYYDSIPLVDAIENILSMQSNEIEYFDNAYLHLKNLSGTTAEDIQSMRENRVILTDDDGAAEFITKTINDTHIENQLRRLTNSFHKITKTPNLTDENFASNSSGVSLKYKLFGMEKDLSKKENKWKKSLQRIIELMASLYNSRGNNFNYLDIKLVFTRALPSNELEQAQIISQLKGLLSDETLISQLSFVEDAAAEVAARDKQQQDLFNTYKDNLGSEEDEK